MTEIALLKMAHLLGLVYWLGGDLGVFYSSFILCDDRKSPAVRVSAGKILFGLDQAPRICMTMMLPLGVHLATQLGFMTTPGWVVPLAWAIGTGWLAMVLVLHFAGHGRKLRLLTRFDFWFRAGLSAGLIVLAASAIIGAIPSITAWAGWKLGIFGTLVLLGLLVRIKLKPFGPAFIALVRGEPTEQDNETIRHSIGGTRPFVIGIWIGLLLNTALGVHLL